MPRKVKNKNKLLTNDGASHADDDMGFRVNEDFARRFEHNKRREELHRLQAKHGDTSNKAQSVNVDEDISSSDDEEEDDGQISADQEAAILDTLLRIKRRDPVIYQPDVHFFEEGDAAAADEAAGDVTTSVKPRKPMYLKDVLARQVLEHGPQASSSDEDDEGQRSRVAQTRPPRVYDKEQEQLRQDFLSAAQAVKEEGEEDAFGGVLKKKKERKKSQQAAADIGGAGEADTDLDPAMDSAPKRKQRQQSSSVDKLVDQVFGHEGADEGDRFLKTFILKRGWIDVDADAHPSRRRLRDDGQAAGSDDDGDEDDTGGSGDLQGDDEFLEEVDRYEAAYNFRYEEPGASRIATHPRVVEGTVRKEDDRRKLQRQAKAARAQDAAAREEEEVKRLKNLKKREIEDRLSKVRRVAGLGSGRGGGLAEDVMGDILDGDFDPDQWDRTMAQAFGDDYYQAEDAAADELEREADMVLLGEGPENAEEEEAMDDVAAGEGFRLLHKKLTQAQGVVDDAAGAQQAAEQRASLQQLLSEYYQLDYEDNVGGVRTRFRYKEVPSNSFGLAVEDILSLDDKDLNQVVGLKRLAPYREYYGKERPNYKALQAITAAGGFNNVGEKRVGRKQQRAQAGTAGRRAPSGQQQDGGQWRAAQDRPGQHKRPCEAPATVASCGGDVPANASTGARSGKHPDTGGASAAGVPPTGDSDAAAAAPPPAVKAGPDALAASRLASYAKLALRKDGGVSKAGGSARVSSSAHGSKSHFVEKGVSRVGSAEVVREKRNGRRSEVDEASVKPSTVKPAWPVGGLQSEAPRLTKAAKKNMKRHAKRAAGGATTNA